MPLRIQLKTRWTPPDFSYSRSSATFVGPPSDSISSASGWSSVRLAMLHLNMAFNRMQAESDSVFNNNTFSWASIAPMKKIHDTMTRLYEAAKALRGVEGPSNVARILNESPQMLNNWERRGMSAHGMLRAAAVLGCSAEWLAGKTPEMTLLPISARGASTQAPNISSATGHVGSANSSEPPNPFAGIKAQIAAIKKLRSIPHEAIALLESAAVTAEQLTDAMRAKEALVQPLPTHSSEGNLSSGEREQQAKDLARTTAADRRSARNPLGSKRDGKTGTRNS